ARGTAPPAARRGRGAAPAAGRTPTPTGVAPRGSGTPRGMGASFLGRAVTERTWRASVAPGAREVNRHDARPALHQIWRYTMRRAPARPNARRDLGARMSDTREHATRLLRAYQAQEKRFVERRFPLQFAPEVPALRELYSQAKGFRWNPETDIPWDRFDPARYSKEVREAARRTWSRRAWSVYPGLTESTALLIRF